MNLISSAQQSLVQTYKRVPMEIVKGQGSFVWDKYGKKYLDFYGGHAVALVGHCPPTVVKAIQKQIEKLLFYSNVFYTVKEFWEIYDKERYLALKNKYDPQNTLDTIYHKCVEKM